jgi:Rad52/22 family double-strand break repair protein
MVVPREQTTAGHSVPAPPGPDRQSRASVGAAAKHEHQTVVCKDCGEVLDDVVLLGSDGRPTRSGWRKIGEQLQKPMATHQARKTGGTYQYLKPRQIMDRLDAVVGPGNWSTSYRVLATDPWAVECTLSIFGVARADCGYSNNPDADPEDKEYEVEPAKAAYSDSLKRAAVHWGIGRWLKKGAPS